MTPAEIQQTLQDGMAALKRGEREAARALLLQVIEADESNETAWLWLGAAVDSVDDQIIALENVLALNPDNVAAQRGLSQLRLKQSMAPASSVQAPPAPTPAPEPEPSTLAFTPQEPPPHATFVRQSAPAFSDAERAILLGQTSEPEPEPTAAPLESVIALDDPYQCLYCGALVAPELKRCPECNRSLVIKEGGNKLSESLRTASFGVMACIALSALEALGVAIFYFQGEGFGDYLYANLPLVGLLIGDFRLWPRLAGLGVLSLQFVMVVLLIAAVLGLLYQVKATYYGSIGLIGFNILWMAYRWRAGYIGPLLAVLDVFFSLVALFFIFASQPDFKVNLTRLRCAIDPHIKGGEALNRLGHIAKGKDQWALAVAYWRAAVAAMPNQAGFYKDLAIGYAQIGYYNRALRTLQEFANQSPDQKDVAPMTELIEQKRARDAHPRD